MTRWDYDDDDWKCRRIDEQNLIDKFLKRSEEVPEFKDTVGKVVENREEIQISRQNTDKRDNRFK